MWVAPDACCGTAAHISPHSDAMSEAYWTVSSGKAERTGYSCRECKKVICKGETVKVREGRKMRFYYHDACFSGRWSSSCLHVAQRTSREPNIFAQQEKQTRELKATAPSAIRNCLSASPRLPVRAVANGQ